MLKVIQKQSNILYKALIVSDERLFEIGLSIP